MEPRVKLYVPREESFPIPLGTSTLPEQHIFHWMSCWKNILKITGTWMKKDNGQMHGFTRFILLNERPPDGHTWSGGRLTRKQTTSRLDNVWPDMWKHMSDAAKRKAKQKWTIGKPKLDNARKLRGIFFIEAAGEDFKNIMKNARRKLEIPMPAAMPCKTPINNGGETYCGIGKSKTKHAYIVDADESMRIRLEGVPQRYHEDHIAAKELNSLSRYNLAHKFIPMPQTVKIPDAKAAVEKEMEKTRENTGMAADESQKQKRGDR